MEIRQHIATLDRARANAIRELAEIADAMRATKQHAQSARTAALQVELEGRHRAMLKLHALTHARIAELNGMIKALNRKMVDESRAKRDALRN